MATESISWEQLVDHIEQVVKHAGEPAQMNRYRQDILDKMSWYDSKEKDFEQYVSYDEECFTKNLVVEYGDICNIMVICWAPGQSSSVHSHVGSRCHVKVLKGHLNELLLSKPSDTNPSVLVDLSGWGRLLSTNEVTYIDDSIGAHLMRNQSNSEPAISLHVYTPPYRKTRVYKPVPVEGGTKLSLEESEVCELEFHNLTRS